MGGKLSRRKKGCMGDPKDEKGEQISETSTIEQKDNETEADCEETNEGTLNKEQRGSDPMPCEEQSKNEPQVDETVHQEHKSTVKATQDQTKESPIAEKSEDLETVQIKTEGNEMEKAPTVTAEQTCEKSVATTAGTKTEGKCAQLEQLPAKITEEKHEMTPAKDLTTCSPAEDNKTAVSSDSAPENIPIKPAVNENSNDKNKTEEHLCSPTRNASNIESTENKKSSGDPMSSRQFNSGNDAHSVSHIDTVAQIHNLNYSKNNDSPANESTVNDSDNLEIVSQLQDESDKCRVPSRAQDIKTVEKTSPLIECVRQDDNCTQQQDTSKTVVADRNSAPVNLEASTDQISCKPLSKQDTKQEFSPAVEHNQTPTNMETDIEDEATGHEAVVAISTETKCSKAQIEVAPEAQQKNIVFPESVDATAEKETTVAESITKPVASPAIEEVFSSLELVDRSDPEEGFSSDLKASVASSQETSHNELPNHSAIEVLASAAEPEACEHSAEVTCLAEGKGSSETTSQAEASQPELADSMDQLEVTPRTETEQDVTRTALLPPTEQEGRVAPEEVESSKELNDSEAQGEATSPDELEADVSPADVKQPLKFERSPFQTQVAPQDELGTCTAQGEVASPSDPKEFVLQKSTSAETNSETSVPLAETDSPTEPHISETSSEQDTCVATVTSNQSKLEEPITSEKSSSFKPDLHEESTEIATLSEFDNTAQEKQVEGKMSAEENTLPESSCKVEHESETCSEPAQETNSHSEPISLRELENHNESNGHLSPAHVIGEKLSPKSDCISNEVLSNGDSEIKGEHENPIASNGSSH